MRTRVKICGITNVEDARLSCELGADAIGFNMYPRSPRYLPPTAAREIVEVIPPLVAKVGLFVNEEADRIKALLSELQFDLLQFHGDESNEFCRQFGLPFIKVLRIKDATDLELIDEYPDSEGILLDAHVVGQFGGTGKTIDWTQLTDISIPMLLAGGLTPENVAEAIRIVAPYGVDVSSGVEREPGKKDPERLRAFFKAVECADRSSVDG